MSDEQRRRFEEATRDEQAKLREQYGTRRDRPLLSYADARRTG